MLDDQQWQARLPNLRAALINAVNCALNAYWCPNLKFSVPQRKLRLGHYGMPFNHESKLKCDNLKVGMAGSPAPSC
jgi:hypothetical protein